MTPSDLLTLARHANPETARAIRLNLHPTAKAPEPVTPEPKSVYRSKTEARYATHLASLQTAGLILAWEYEPLTFNLGVRFKPDFLIRPLAGLPTLVEVKGSWKAKNARDSRTRLKVAAKQWGWCFRFVAVTPDGRGWKEEVIQC